jgi:PqqA peptide cyclase
MQRVGSDPQPTETPGEVTLDGHGNPLWLALELTHRCPLKCPWCNNPLELDKKSDELTTDEWKKVLRDGRELGALQLGLTGGEPAMRDDLEELVGYANDLDYYVNLITSGIGLDHDRLSKLKDAGLHQIQLSIQHSDPATLNSLVGARSYDKKMEIAASIKQLGFPMVMNVPVCKQNIDDSENLLALAEELGVDYLEFANIQYYNWAIINRRQLMPTREQILRSEELIMEARERLAGKMTLYFVVPDYFDGRPKACMNGWGAIHLTIAPNGQALPCQEARVIETMTYPNVKDHSLSWIWHESPEFNMYRGDEWMKEPCKTCDDKAKDFAGCRCQAHILTGDAANPDPACSLAPQHNIVQAAVADSSAVAGGEAPLVYRKDRGALAFPPVRRDEAKPKDAPVSELAPAGE